MKKYVCQFSCDLVVPRARYGDLNWRDKKWGFQAANRLNRENIKLRNVVSKLRIKNRQYCINITCHFHFVSSTIYCIVETVLKSRMIAVFPLEICVTLKMAALLMCRAMRVDARSVHRQLSHRLWVEHATNWLLSHAHALQFNILSIRSFETHISLSGLPNRLHFGRHIFNHS